MSVEKGHHCAYSTHYHIVLPIKYRKTLLQEPIVASIKNITTELEERYEFEVETIGADRNHLHILCSFHPKYSIGQIVRIYKSNTARELFKRHTDLKKELWGGELWSDGYYAATIGEKGSYKIIEQYIKDQGQKPKEAQLRLL